MRVSQSKNSDEVTHSIIAMIAKEVVLTCARASELIYGSPTDPNGKTSSEEAMTANGFSDFAWIDVETIFKDTCCFVVTSADYHLLAFRGTKIPQDWMTDLACTPVRFDWMFSGAPTIGQIHAGFGHCLADGLSDIMNKLSKRDSTKPLVITGHSLGGALAALAGAYFTIGGACVPTISGICTFGQPRIGLHDFCNTYSRVLSGKLVRFVNKEDVVPRVPLRGFDYSDEGIMIHFDSSGTPQIQSAEWQSFLARAFQSLEDVVEMVKDLRVDVGDHSVTGYREMIEKNLPQIGRLIQEAL
jgi:hypothetical protein